MKILMKSISNKYKFSTFEIHQSKSILSSHMFIGDREERVQIAEDVFEFINTVYDELGGFKSFKDINKFIDDSYLWYITYEGEQPRSLDDFDINKVYVVSVFRNKFGLKCVGVARRIIGRNQNNKEENKLMREKANDALNEHIQFICKRGWAEVSGKIEKKFYSLFKHSNVIDPYDLIDHKVFKNIEVDVDEFHYWRPLRSGEEPTMKIAYGQIKF